MTGSTTPSDSKKFTKREWIHLIITLSIIQAFIWFVSLKFAGNPSALGYVSFAGTLISIILAVLAIGYTYGESQQQKNTSVTFANQLDSLVKIKDKLEIQAEALSDIRVLKSAMDEFSKKVYSHLESTRKGFDDFRKDFGGGIKNDKKGDLEDDHGQFTTAFFTDASPFNKLCLILLLDYVKNDKRESRYNIGIVELYTYMQNLNIENLDEIEKNRLFGGMAAWFQVLNRIGVLSYESEYINPGLMDIFNEFVENPSEDFLNSFEGAAGSILKIVKDHDIQNRPQE